MRTFKELETKSALDLMDWLRTEKEACLKNSNNFLSERNTLNAKSDAQRYQLHRFSTHELMKAELFEQNLCELRKNLESQSFNY